MTTDLLATEMAGIRSRTHCNCIVCSPSNEHGFRLEFTRTEDGGVEAHFPGSRSCEGYVGWLHGGVISSLLDGAMTNCLFARGLVAVTSELTVRFRQPVSSEVQAVVRARIDRSGHRLHVLKAELVQEEQVKAQAVGKFMERSVAPEKPVEPERHEDATS